MRKMQKISSLHYLQIFVCFHSENMTEKWVFNVGNCWEQQVFQIEIYGNNFHPSKSGQQALDCKQKTLFKHEFFTHTSVSYLLKDRLLLEQPTPLLPESVNDVLHVDLPLKRHISGILQVDDGLPCAFSRLYFSPLQHWIDLACAGTCHPCSDFYIGHHVMM
jgi:hypothetical protein